MNPHKHTLPLVILALMLAQLIIVRPLKAAKLTAERYRALDTFAKALFYLETMYIDQEKVNPSLSIENALHGIVSKLDPHTILMPRKAFEQLTIDTKGKFGGVGIIVSQERGKLKIISPIEGSPADLAGIKSGDEIIKINDKPLNELPGDQAVDMMRGLPGSTLKLTIKRNKETLNFSLMREVIKVKSVRGRKLSKSIYYSRIASFQENTASELSKLLRAQDKSQIQGLILDLRDNPGGLLEQSVKVADLFIESGLIVSTVGRDPDRVEREFAHKTETFANFPMIVLVNDGSASASEIVAGALQDLGRAVVMGTTTFGKGSVQTLVSLPDGSGLKLTVARYFTPNDRSIQAKGIVPDIIVTKADEKRQNTKQSKKERDLEGHISSHNLSNFSNKKKTESIVAKWPKNMQKDRQLLTAYTYLKGWNIMRPAAKSNEKAHKK